MFADQVHWTCMVCEEEVEMGARYEVAVASRQGHGVEVWVVHEDCARDADGADLGRIRTRNGLEGS